MHVSLDSERLYCDAIPSVVSVYVGRGALGGGAGSGFVYDAEANAAADARGDADVDADADASGDAATDGRDDADAARAYETVGVNRARQGDNIGFAVSPAIVNRVVPALVAEGDTRRVVPDQLTTVSSSSLIS